MNTKTAIITGAASGMGRAAAQLFVAEGYKVVAVDRDETLLKQLAAESDSEPEPDVAGLKDQEGVPNGVHPGVEQRHPHSILHVVLLPR